MTDQDANPSPWSDPEGIWFELDGHTYGPFGFDDEDGVEESFHQVQALIAERNDLQRALDGQRRITNEIEAERAKATAITRILRTALQALVAAEDQFTADTGIRHGGGDPITDAVDAARLVIAKASDLHHHLTGEGRC